MPEQSTNKILMIRPANFGFNAETADSNRFQNQSKQGQETIQQKVLIEFDIFVKTLKANGVTVEVIEDTPSPIKPDALFPNNWLSLHIDGTISLYPMATPNRQAEVRLDIIEQLKQTYWVNQVIDLRRNATNFLEGTGSIVFDHLNQIAFACRSIRTDEKLLNLICEQLNYKDILFDAVDLAGKPIYHTNVMMAIGTQFVVICSESIRDTQQKEAVLSQLKNTRPILIEIDFSQMNQFAGNVLEVKNSNNETLIVLSQTAFNSFTPQQIEQLQSVGKLIPINIDTIETIGGGSARCMMAENFLQHKN